MLDGLRVRLIKAYIFMRGKIPGLERLSWLLNRFERKKVWRWLIIIIGKGYLLDFEGFGLVGELLFLLCIEGKLRHHLHTITFEYFSLRRLLKPLLLSSVMRLWASSVLKVNHAILYLLWSHAS